MRDAEAWFGAKDSERRGSERKGQKSLASTYMLHPLESYVLLFQNRIQDQGFGLQRPKINFRSEVKGQRFTEGEVRGVRGEQSSECETEFTQREEENRGV